MVHAAAAVAAAPYGVSKNPTSVVKREANLISKPIRFDLCAFPMVGFDPNLKEEPMTRIEELHAAIENHGGSRACLLWHGPVSHNGYGTAKSGGGKVRVHRVACWAAHGAPTEERNFALHSCHTPSCYNPLHLRWGNNKENMADKKADGTNNHGENHQGSKLTEEQVLEIRSTAAAQAHLPMHHPDRSSQRLLGSIYGVHQVQIGNIIRGTRWAYLNEET